MGVTLATIRDQEASAVIDLVVAIAEVLARAEPGDDYQAVARAVLARLGDEDVSIAIHEAIHAAEMSARSAHAARDDLFENPMNSRFTAEVATTAVTELITKSIREVPQVDLVAAREIASTVTYRDWTFKAVAMASGRVGVKVLATNADSRDPSRTFTTSRFTEVTSTVEEACFRAALLVEVHEAQERFRARGQAVFDSHSADNLPAPTNLRRAAFPEFGTPSD